MGRRAGTTAEETKAQLLRAAADVFADRGYAGASISDIADEADLSSGAIYAHYRGKAHLFLAVLERYGRSDLARRLHDGEPLDIGTFLIQAGARLDRRPAAQRTLLIEAIMAAKQDEEVRTALSGWFADQHEFFASSLAAAQRSGTMDPDFSPAAAARLAAAVMLGTLVLDVLDVPKVEPRDWDEAIRRVVASFGAAP